MRRQVVALLSAVSLLAAAAPVSTAPLAPMGVWKVEYGEDRCSASHRFGDPVHPVDFLLSLAPFGAGATYLLIADAPEDKASPPTLTLTFDHDEPQSVSYERLSTKDAGRQALRWTMKAMPSSRLQRLHDVRVRAGYTDYHLKMPETAGVSRAMSKCMDDLLRDWGIDSAVFNAETVHVGLDPISRLRSEDYPMDAVRAGAEGRAVAVVSVDRSGRATACRTVKSSRNASLDRRTCEIAMRRLAFTPARDASGNPADSSYVFPMTWTLPRE